MSDAYEAIELKQELDAALDDVEDYRRKYEEAEVRISMLNEQVRTLQQMVHDCESRRRGMD